MQTRWPSKEMGLPSILIAVAVAVALASSATATVSDSYERPKARADLSLPSAEDASGVTPQQVHISLAGADKMRVTWITGDDDTPTVMYGVSSGSYPFSASGSTSSYSYLFYRSGKIHDVVIGPLDPSAVYYYRLGSNPTREFSLRTPPAQLPIKFAVAGDLGQTGWTRSTLEHVSGSAYDVLLLPGDLSYADFYQPLWDSFGRLIEPLASSRPWMVTQGNHEIERIPILHGSSFTAYNARWRMPYEASGSGSNLFYSFDSAGGSVHVLMLGSYTDFGAGSSQYQWLESDLAKLDRRRTPWLVALIHAPWYNSYNAHRGEGEDMRKALEALLYRARVDIVFAGHVHAYERFTRVYDGKADACGSVHITIGDGGNREGLATEFVEAKPPEISAFREASFGHGQFEVVNATHATWAWNRNDDDMAVVADRVWLTSLGSDPTCIKK